jgi:predicted nucleic acid-binding protein
VGAPTKEAKTRRLRIIICDTGPVLHLHEAAALGLLKQAGEVIIPRAVELELKQLLPEWPRRKPRWLRVLALAAQQRRAPVVRQLAQELGEGEAEAITLARSLKADWLLTDDAEARVVAQLAGLEVHGSLGVIVWAAATGRLDEAAAYAALARLGQSSLWMSRRIRAEATAALRNLFD